MTGSDINGLKFYYYDSGISGRGEFVHLLLKDSGMPFQYIRKPGKEATEMLVEWGKSDQPPVTLPAIELEDGTRLGGTETILQFLASKLGYSLDDEKETAFVSMVGDLAHDWLLEFVLVKFRPGNKESYLSSVQKYQNRFERFYRLRNGPYLAGEKITYADFIMYHTLRTVAFESSKDTPHLAAFLNAFESRPRIKAYLESFDHKAEYEKASAFIRE